jgi:hypothetical protein
VVKSREASGAFHIKEAATFTREESGKIRLNHKGYVAGWKGGGIGLGIGILLRGPVGFAAVGGISGYLRAEERRRLRDKLNEKLGPEQSAIALMLDDPIDWDVLREVGNTSDAELLHAELRGEPLPKVAELAEDDPIEVGLTPDPDDDYSVSLARAARAQVLVSGDADLVNLEHHLPPVRTPRQMVELLDEIEAT